MTLTVKTILLGLATTVVAQYGPGGRYGPGGNYGNHDNDGDDDDDQEYYSGSNRITPYLPLLESRRKILIAHAVLACLAFVIFFPVGSILIRLGKFRGVWLVHGLFQLFAYLVYIAAFGIGVWMVNNIPVDLLSNYHPIIGIIVLVMLFFQPILGLVHHLKFKKYSRRTVWSHAHLWIGRIVITLGIINGGLGLHLASDAPAFSGFAPSNGQIIAYGVIAGCMWSLWVIAAIIGERRRAKGINQRAAKEAEVESSSDDDHSHEESHYVSELGAYEPRREKERYAHNAYA